MTAKLHITLAQINPVVGDIRFNIKKISDVIEKESKISDLIVFPEMALCGYPPEDLVLKPFFLDRVEDAIQEIADLTKGMRPAVLLPTPLRIKGKTYNGCALIKDGQITGQTTKHHLPNYGVFDEQRIFAQGPLPVPMALGDFSPGVMICEDMWHPDLPSALKKKGADILIVINGSPFEAEKNDVRLHFAEQRVRETGLPLVYVNLVGGQDELVFDGASFVLSASGDLVLQAEEFVEDIRHIVLEKTAEGDWLQEIEEITPTHEDEDAIYQALVIGLRDYVTKNGFPGVLLGVSGGIDSALCAAIAVDALGPEAVHCVMMPSPYTSQDSLDDAAELAKNLDVHLDMIAIDPAMEAFDAMLKPHVHDDAPGITFENIQSRSRGLILMALSNASGRMVLSTGNKSEMAVGYATLYGDMCGGFNPLKDIYKTQAYTLAKWRNENKPDHAFGPEKAVIPERIITKEPSAELKEDQTDQDTLPPYEELDDILMCLIERDMGLPTIVERGHKRETVEKVWSMLDNAEYKRRQAPPGIKITSRAFGRDRRYPITNHFLKSVDK